MTNVDSQRIKEIRDNTRAMAEAFGRIANTLAEALELYVSTQTETQNSNLTFEKRKCVDCNFLTYMFGKTWCNIKCENPHDKVCDRFKPKDEPQTELVRVKYHCINCAENGSYKCSKCDGEMYYKYDKDEPQTEMPRCSVNGRPYDCGNCEYHKCMADEPQTEREGER